VEPGDAKLISETLVFIGPDSAPAARAAFAAGQQDLYWQYAALLFENQGAENSGYVTDEFLTDLARQTEGLDVNEWNEARQRSFEKSVAGRPAEGRGSRCKQHAFARGLRSRRPGDAAGRGAGGGRR
jgi:hypothetical protein